MPLNAIEAGVVDHQVTAAEAGTVLAELADRQIEERPMEPHPGMKLENTISMGPRFLTEFDAESLGPPSGYTCPDCNGSLLTVRESNFRCRVGHAWTGEAVLAARDNDVETALWVALRGLHEKAKLSRRLAENSGPSAMGLRYHELADEAERAIVVLGRRLTEAAAGEPGQSGGE